MIVYVYFAYSAGSGCVTDAQSNEEFLHKQFCLQNFIMSVQNATLLRFWIPQQDLFPTQKQKILFEKKRMKLKPSFLKL